MQIKSTSRFSDGKFLGVILLVALGVSSAPYLFAWLTAPHDLVFMGIVQNGPDSGEYLAWIRESMQSVFISNMLTPEPNAPAFFNLNFWLLGQLARFTGLSLAIIYQLFRIVSGGLFLVAAFYFSKLMLSDLMQQRIAFLLIVFGSGFSFYVTLIEKVIGEFNFPTQFVAEGTTLYSLMSFPLLMLGAALFCAIFILAFNAYQQKKMRLAFWAGILALILGWSHGYDLILVYSVLSVFTFIVLWRDGLNWQWLKSVALIFGLSIWGPLYMTFLTRTNPTWREALGQFGNAGIFSPNPLFLVLLLGLPLIIALISFDGFLPLHERDPRDLFVKTWFVVNAFLIYLPVDYQIHFINGWQIPIAILATGGLFRHVFPRLAKLNFFQHWHTERAQIVWASVLLILVVPTSIYFIGWRILDMSRYSAPYFLHRDQVDALTWLNENAPRDSVVLSAYETGHWIPAMTGARAFLAHWAMTLRFYEKREMVERFFQPTTSDMERMSTLNRFGVTYVYWSSVERTLGAWHPSQAEFLEPVWSAPHAAVYQVKIK